MFRGLIVALILAAPVAAQQPQPVEALSTCLAENTSGKDRKDLARWIFLAIAAHPDMKPHTAADLTAATDESSRVMGALVTRLLADSCVNQTKAVMAANGPQSLQLAFQNLGQLAMAELTTDKSVQTAMALFERYVDQQRFSQAFGR